MNETNENVYVAHVSNAHILDLESAGLKEPREPVPRNLGSLHLGIWGDYTSEPGESAHKNLGSLYLRIWGVCTTEPTESAHKNLGSLHLGTWGVCT